MKTTFKIGIAATAFLAAAGVAGVAFAQGGGKMRGAMLANISVPVANAEGIAACLFDRLDRDGDGLADARPSREEREAMRAEGATLEDFQSRAAQRFAQADMNGDGLVDAADRELAQAKAADCLALIGIDLEQIEAQRAERGDGERAERGESGGRGEHMGRGGRGGHEGFGRAQQLAGRVLLSDLKDQGIEGLSQADITAAVTAKLNNLDANADGVVTGGEIMDAMAQMRAQRHADDA